MHPGEQHTQHTEHTQDTQDGSGDDQPACDPRGDQAEADRDRDDDENTLAGADGGDPFAPTHHRTADDADDADDDAPDPLEAARLADVDERDELDYWDELTRPDVWDQLRHFDLAPSLAGGDPWLDAEDDDDWLDEEEEAEDDEDEGEGDDDEEDEAPMDGVEDWDALDELDGLDELDEQRQAAADDQPGQPGQPDRPNQAATARTLPPGLARDPFAMLCALDEADARRAGRAPAPTRQPASGAGAPGSAGSSDALAALRGLIRAPQPRPPANNGHANGHANNGHHAPPAPDALPAGAWNGRPAADVADGGTSAEGAHDNDERADWLTAAELDAVCHDLANAATAVGLLAFALARPDLQPGSMWVTRAGLATPHPRLHATFALIRALFEFEDAVEALLRALGLEEEAIAGRPHRPADASRRAPTGDLDQRGQRGDHDATGREGSPA